MPIEEFAPAKVNLTLHVTGQRSDGYHLLDSLVMFADIGDRLTVALADERALQVTGPMAAGVPCDASNLVWRAMSMFAQPVRVTLEKHLPAAAGIGGGSSDAAAAIRALRALTGQSEEGAILDLGADVPVCLLAHSARMQGIGAQVTALPLPALDAVLVNPRVAVPTSVVFRALAHKDNTAMQPVLPDFVEAGAFTRWLAGCRNDLEAPARAVQPVIDTVIKAIAAQPGVLLARMSGSGATCFGLFANPADAQEAARALRMAQPGWWVRACRLH